MVNGLTFRRPSELIEDSKQRRLSQLELLILKSRSFAIPIYLLGNLRGAKEVDKKEEVQNLYIDLRELDTIEDCTLPVPEKLALMGDFAYAFNEVVKRKQEDSIDDLIEKLGSVTERLRKGTTYNNKLDEEEDVFVQQFGYGDAFRKLQGFEDKIKVTIKDCINEMRTGMEEFLKRGEIKTAFDLERYCDYVAGSVGAALTEIVRIKDGRQLNIYDSRKFGEYLQMVNVMKNIRDDYKKRGMSFIPKETSHGLSYDELFNKTDKMTKAYRLETFGMMVHLAERNFKTSVTYVNSINEELPGYTAFCLMPLITAYETLKTMKESGVEAVFKGDESAIKIKKETFENIYVFTERIVQLDNGIRTKSWETEYRDNPKNFSFRPGEYEKWAHNWMR